MKFLRFDTVPNAALCMLSQSMISSVSFLASLSLLHYGQQADYAVYVLIISTYLLLSSMLNALLMHPLASLSCRMSAGALGTTLRLGMLGCTVLAGVGAASLTCYWRLNDPLAAPVVSLYGLCAVFCLLLWRDLRRAAWLLDSDLPSLLRVDILYCLLALALLCVEAWRGWINLDGVLLAMGLPALSCVLRHIRPKPRIDTVLNPILPDTRWRDIWHCARWAVPGVWVTWLYSNGFWFYLDSTQGKSVVALLAASRLLFTPIGLISSGWTSYFRPVFARLEYAGDHREKTVLVRRSCLGAASGTLLYTVFLVVALWRWPQWMPARLGREALVLIWAWGGYFLLQWVRVVRATDILASPTGFRVAFYAGAIPCAGFYLLLLPISHWSHDPLVCPLLMMAAEIGIFVLLRDRKQALPQGASGTRRADEGC